MQTTLGILGGGQLGRMLALAAHPLGVQIVAVDPHEDAPVSVAARQIVAPYDDEAALETLSRCDFATFEFENVPDSAVAKLQQSLPAAPPARALSTAQDRLLEKELFTKLAIATNRFRDIKTEADLAQAQQDFGKLVLKTRRFGYDGKGQAVISQAEEVAPAFERLAGRPAIAEEWVPFDREVSIICVRNRKGEIRYYPLSENLHRAGVLRRSIAPAPAADALIEQAQTAASKLATELDYVGVLAIEFFVKDGKLIANECAPRVHNSGHWTIEGAVTSQFENHVRAVCDLPLGSTHARGCSVMLNFLGKIPPREQLLAVEGCHLHDYGKAERAGRKVGHLTLVAETLEQALDKAKKLEALIDSE